MPENKSGRYIDYQKYKDADMSALTAGERKVLEIRMRKPDMTQKEFIKLCGMGRGTPETLLSRAVKKLGKKYCDRRLAYSSRSTRKERTDLEKYRGENLDILPKTQRKYLSMALSGMTIAEIAKQCGRTQQAVGAAIIRAKETLEHPYAPKRVKRNHCKKWNLVDPNGAHYEVHNLTGWARENCSLFGFDASGENAEKILKGLSCAKRKGSKYKGWKAAQADSDYKQ